MCNTHPLPRHVTNESNQSLCPRLKLMTSSNTEQSSEIQNTAEVKRSPTIAINNWAFCPAISLLELRLVQLTSYQKPGGEPFNGQAVTEHSCHQHPLGAVTI